MVKLRKTLTSDQIALGFDSSTDIFDNKNLADRLYNLFINLESGSVCLLDGRWGTGKSTFVKQWCAELRKSGRGSIYFDAFAADYLDTPFTALAGIFVRAAHDAKKDDNPAVKNFLNKAAKIGKALAATTAKVGIKAATLGVMDGNEIEGLGEAIADGLGEISEASVKKLLEDHSQRQDEFEALRTSLHDLTQILRSDADNVDKEYPLVIFIDELDRCRPDFSLGILEILKHFFSSDGVHFVLVSNKSYLEMAVCGRYGDKISGSEYLEKFYDFIVMFESNNDHLRSENIKKFVKLTIDGFCDSQIQIESNFIENLQNFCVGYNLTLRQIENVCINSCLGYLSVSNLNLFKPPVLIIFCAIVKSLDLELYNNVRNGNLSWADAKSFLHKGVWPNRYGDRLEKILQWYIDPNIDIHSDEWSGFGNDLWRYDLDRLSAIKFICSSVVDRFSGPSTE